MKVKIEISADHGHLSRSDLEVLFGKNYSLKVLKKISQFGQFAAKETVSVSAGKGKLPEVRIVGPVRDSTIIEISKSTAYRLGIKPRVVGYKYSAPAKDGVLATISGPKGKVKRKSIIIANRHFHCDPKTASKVNLKTGDKISVVAGDLRKTTFHNVLVRVGPDYRPRLHLDTDEANAAGLHQGQEGEIIFKNK